MNCAGTSCHQGRRTCMTPMACSGFVPQSTAYHCEPEEDDFLKQDNALSALALYVVRPLVIGTCIGAALYFIGRAVGLF